MDEWRDEARKNIEVAERNKELSEHLLFLREQIRLGPRIELYKAEACAMKIDYENKTKVYEEAVKDLIDSQSSHPHPHPHSDQTPA